MCQYKQLRHQVPLAMRKHTEFSQSIFKLDKMTGKSTGTFQGVAEKMMFYVLSSVCSVPRCQGVALGGERCTVQNWAR